MTYTQKLEQECNRLQDELSSAETKLTIWEPRWECEEERNRHIQNYESWSYANKHTIYGRIILIRFQDTNENDVEVIRTAYRAYVYSNDLRKTRLIQETSDVFKTLDAAKQYIEKSFRGAHA